jgi:hypothetical protein
MLPATGDIAFPPGRDHGACSFVANQQVWVQQIFGGRPDSKRGLSRSFTSSKLQISAILQLFNLRRLLLTQML